MPDPVRDRAAAHLETALGKPVDLSDLSDETALNTLGMDSLLTITALVGLSEDYGVDLAKHADTLAAPRTVGDLLAIATRFAAEQG